MIWIKVLNYILVYRYVYIYLIAYYNIDNYKYNSSKNIKIQ
jgi:hypothetical protein